MKLRIIAGLIALSLPVFVLADVTATSTDSSTSTSPIVTSDLNGNAATSSAADTATEPSSAQPDQTADTATTSAPSDDVAAPAEATTPPIAVKIAKLENTYFQGNGTYLQVLPGNTLPSYESGTVLEDLGDTLPDDARVDTYVSPNGPGYQISFQDSGTQYSVGYGPEATSRTYSSPLEAPPSATSTPSIALDTATATTTTPDTASATGTPDIATTTTPANADTDLIDAASTTSSTSSVPDSADDTATTTDATSSAD